MSGFNNPVVGALNLVRRAIRSPNYEPGAAGWSIDQDGSAEFNDVTLTGGSLVVTQPSQGVFVYSGEPTLGNLIVSIASAAGTDPFGNEYLSGIAADRIIVADNATITGILSAGNIAVGTTLITPSAANTPTSKIVNFGPLLGSEFFGIICAATTVPGTQVTGVGITTVTDTGAVLWVTRTNTTQTRVNYLIFGV